MQFKPGDTIAFDSGEEVKVTEVREGGMGVVYFCRQKEKPYIDVAYKTLKDEFLNAFPKAGVTFERECKIWIKIGNHPFIVEARKIERIGDRVFVQMWQYADSLRGLINNGSLNDRFPVISRLVLEISIALTHAKRVIPFFVHQDLKPENILLGAWHGRHDNEIRKNAIFSLPYNAAVSDFGLARAGLVAGSTEIQGRVEGKEISGIFYSKAGPICGTPPYMAPEQCLGMPLDEKTDIYSLGCILYELLCGRLAFPGNTPEEILRFHFETNLTPPKELNSVIPAALSDIAMKCLERNPRDRFLSFSDLTKHLFSVISLSPEIRVIFDGIERRDFVANPNTTDETKWIQTMDHLHNALKYVQLGSEKLALRETEKAKQVCEGKLGIFLLGLARVLFNGDPSDSIERFKELTGYKDKKNLLIESIKRNPEYLPRLPAYRFLAEAYEMEGNKIEQRKVYEDWLNQNPKEERAYGGLIGLAGDDTDAITTVIQRWEKQDPNNSHLKLEKGLLFERNGNIHAALTEYETGAQTAPKSPGPIQRENARRFRRLSIEIGKPEMAIPVLKNAGMFFDAMKTCWKVGEKEELLHCFDCYLDSEKSFDDYKYPFQSRIKESVWTIQLGSWIERWIDKQTGVKNFKAFSKLLVSAKILSELGYGRASIKILRILSNRYEHLPAQKRWNEKEMEFRENVPMVLFVINESIKKLESKLGKDTSKMKVRENDVGFLTQALTSVKCSSL